MLRVIKSNQKHGRTIHSEGGHFINMEDTPPGRTTTDDEVQIRR